MLNLASRSESTQLRRVIQAFPRSRILVVGDLVADHYIFGHTERISREAPVLIVRYEQAEVKLGGGANAAANARSMGGQVTAIGLLGDDEMGWAMRRNFKAAGIRLRSLATSATETKTRILAGGVNTTRQQMLRLDRSAPTLASAKARAGLARAVLMEAKSADAVVVSDYGAGAVGHEVRQALRQVASSGVPVCVDSRHQLAAFTGVTVCKPNEPELEALTGIAVRSERSLMTAGHKALELLACSSLLVTRGRNGMTLFTSHGAPELIPVSGPQEAVDVTGAGDTVIAALALGLASGAKPSVAARIANIAGGLVVQKQGTATVDRSELLAAVGGPKS